MSHVSSNLAALLGGAGGLTDPLLYQVRTTQQSTALVPGDAVILCVALRPITVTLPPAGYCEGRAFTIIKVDITDNPVNIISSDPSDLIFSTGFTQNGVRQFPLTEHFGTRTFLSDGQRWIVSQYSGVQDYPGLLPDGGTTGQVLIKTADTDYSTGWVTPYWVPLSGAARAATPDGITTAATVVLPADPQQAMEAATKRYVDARASVYTDTWTWTVKLTDANTAGQVGLNAAAWAATALNLNKKTTNNRDATRWLASYAAAGGTVDVQQKTDASRWGRYHLTGAGVDEGTWVRYPVTLLGSGGTPPGGNADTDVTIFH